MQLQQTWYSNPLASTVDGNYSGAYTGREASSYSPIAMTTRVSPTRTLSASTASSTTRRPATGRSIGAVGRRQSAAMGDVERRLEPAEVRVDDDVALTVQQLLQHRHDIPRCGAASIGGRYALDANLADGTLVQQRIGGFYHAQCCGVSLEYQAWNYGTATSLVVPKDRRFSLSFTLAGVGSFSNVLGIFGIGQGAK